MNYLFSFRHLDTMPRFTLRLIFSAIGLFVCFILLAFVMSNSGDKIHIQESQPVNCDCPLTQERVPNIIPSVLTVRSNKVRLATCKEVQKTSPVQRAIIIYYPHHQSEYFFPEVRW